MTPHLLFIVCSILVCVHAVDPIAVCNIFGFAGTSVTVSPWGTLNMSPISSGEISVFGDIYNIGWGGHGIHIHQWGDLADPGASGPHYNPTGAHACSKVDGEWGNITSNGTRIQDEATLLMNINITNKFENIIGRSIIVHEMAENCAQPGSAGARIAGCVIGVASSDLNITLGETETPSCVLGSTADSTVAIFGSISITEQVENNTYILHISGNITGVQQGLNISLLMDGNLDSPVDGSNTNIVSPSFSANWISSRSSLGRTILLRPLAPSSTPSPSSSVSPSSTPSSSLSPSSTPSPSMSPSSLAPPSSTPSPSPLIASPSPSKSPSSAPSPSPSMFPSRASEPSPEPPIGFCVVGRKAATPSVTPSTAPTQSITPSSSAVATQSFLPSPSSTASDSKTEESPNQTGMIVGVVFAGLILIGLGLFLYRRSKRNQRQGFTRTIGEF